MQTLTGETLEETTYRTICAIDHSIPRCNDTCACHSALSVYDTSHMIQRMISSVNVATAHRDEPSIAYVGAKDRHSRVTPEAVAKKFRCGLETAQRTLKTTSQRGVRHSIHPLHRRYRVDHLNLHRRRLQDTFYMDTLFSNVKSLGGTHVHSSSLTVHSPKFIPWKRRQAKISQGHCRNSFMTWACQILLSAISPRSKPVSTLKS
jgi:hypothetical protein